MGRGLLLDNERIVYVREKGSSLRVGKGFLLEGERGPLLTREGVVSRRMREVFSFSQRGEGSFLEREEISS